MSAMHEMDKPRRPAKQIPDYAEKRFPNGIAATIRGIQYYWHNITTGGPVNLTPDKFFTMTRFGKIYYDLLDKYPGITKPQNDSSVVDDIANNRHDIQYFKLRAFAELVEIPTGLLLLFTRFVSDERNFINDERDIKALKEIRAMKAFLDEMEKIVVSSNESKELAFTVDLKSRNKTKRDYIPKISVLKRLSDAYNASLKRND